MVDSGGGSLRKERAQSEDGQSIFMPQWYGFLVEACAPLRTAFSSEPTLVQERVLFCFAEQKRIE